MANIVSAQIAKAQGGDYDASYLSRLAKAQRRQAMAQQLQQQSLDDVKVDPRGAVSWTQGLAKMLQGYMGAKMAGDSDAQLAQIQSEKDAAEQASFDSLYGGQPITKAADGQPSSADLAAALKGEQASQQSSYNNMSLFGDPAKDRALQRQIGTAAYMKLAAENLKPTDTIKNWNAQGIDPRSMAQNTRAEAEQKGRVTLNGNQYDASGNLLISAPDANGYYQTQNPNGSYTAQESRGFTGMSANRAGATTAATEAQKFSPATLANGAQVNLPQGLQLQATMGGGLPTAGGQMPIGQSTFGKAQQTDLAQQDVKNQQAFKDLYAQSSSTISNIGVLKKVNDLASEGSLANIETNLANGAASLGIDVGKFKSANALASAISNELVLKAKNSGGTNLMPGSMTEQDRQFLTVMAPQLSQSREGRMAVASFLEKKALRDQEISQAATNYAQQNGSLQGFDSVVQSQYKGKPLFSDKEYEGMFGGKKESNYSEDEYTRLLKKHGISQ